MRIFLNMDFYAGWDRTTRLSKMHPAATVRESEFRLVTIWEHGQPVRMVFDCGREKSLTKS